MRLIFTHNTTRLIILVLGAVSFSANSASFGQSLRAWLETSKNSFRQCEKPFVFLHVANSGAHQATIPVVDESSVLDRDRLRLVIVSEKGDTIRYGGLTHLISTDSLRIMPPDTAVFLFDILASWGKGGFRTKYPPSLGPGKYTVSASYMGSVDAGRCSFTITPMSDEDEKNVAIFMQVMGSRLQGRERLDSYVAAYYQLKDTEYGPLAGEMMLLLADARQIPFSTRVQLASEFLARFPRNGVGRLAYALIMRYSENELERQQAFARISALRSDSQARNIFKAVCIRNGWMAVFKEVTK